MEENYTNIIISRQFCLEQSKCDMFRFGIFVCGLIKHQANKKKTALLLYRNCKTKTSFGCSFKNSMEIKATVFEKAVAV